MQDYCCSYFEQKYALSNNIYFHFQEQKLILNLFWSYFVRQYVQGFFCAHHPYAHVHTT